jgi:hypothetical protein
MIIPTELGSRFDGGMDRLCASANVCARSSAPASGPDQRCHTGAVRFRIGVFNGSRTIFCATAKGAIRAE